MNKIKTNAQLPQAIVMTSYYLVRYSGGSYEDAFDVILHNKPHWVISFRDMSFYNEEDYWEFGGSNLGSNSYGTVFIWIQVNIKDAEEIFNKFNLKQEKY